jgi:hypothetical protein
MHGGVIANNLGAPSARKAGEPPCITDSTSDVVEGDSVYFLLDDLPIYCC